MALVGVVLDLREPGGVAAYGLDDFRVAMSVQYLFWAFGICQILRYRRKALAHLRRVHPGAVEPMKRGEPFVHPASATARACEPRPCPNGRIDVGFLVAARRTPSAEASLRCLP